jgi:hypothetical protein
MDTEAALRALRSAGLLQAGLQPIYTEFIVNVVNKQVEADETLA